MLQSNKIDIFIYHLKTESLIEKPANQIIKKKIVLGQSPETHLWFAGHKTHLWLDMHVFSNLVTRGHDQRMTRGRPPIMHEPLIKWT